MKISSIWIIITILSFSVNAQNLVLNPGFENTDSCLYTGGAQVEINDFNNVPFWAPAQSDGTCDFYHPCFGANSSPLYRYPNNLPRSGQGEAGIISFRGNDCVINHASYYEYLQGTLCSELKAGKTYTVSFWVRLVDNLNEGTDGIGATLSAAPLSVTGGFGSQVSLSPAEYSTSVFNPTGNFINHTWKEISGTIVAQGNERFITIGHIKNTAPNSPSMSPVDQSLCDVYFLIDDVSVTEHSQQASCDRVAWIENKLYSTDEIESVADAIYAGYDVSYPTTNGDVEVLLGSDVEYLAGIEIELHPGFSISADNNTTSFYAHIIEGHCNAQKAATANAGEDFTLSCYDPPFTQIGDDCSEVTYTWSADPPEAYAWLINPNSCYPYLNIPYSAFLSGLPYIDYTLWVNQGMCDENMDVIRIYLTCFNRGNSTMVENSNNETTYLISPNPNDGNFVLKAIGTDTPTQYTITSVMGQIIQRGEFTNETQLRLEGNSSGVYFILFTNGNKRITEKFTIK